MERNETKYTGFKLVEKVTEELVRRGHRATFEYPGFVMITEADGTTWNTGTANDTWTVDHLSADGSEHLIDGGDTYVRVDCPYASVIADMIERFLDTRQARTKTETEVKTDAARRWVVRCWVSGGVTGTRESVLKANGEIKYFETEAAAQVEADRMTRERNHGHASAFFRYWPAPAAEVL
jgi:hypothetical protein